MVENEVSGASDDRATGVSGEAGIPRADFRWERLCLSDEPFAGDFGDPSDRVLSDAMVTNRKGGICHTCAGSCLPKTRSRVRVEIYDGELMRFRWCTECCFAMAAYALGRFSLAERREAIGHQRRSAARQGAPEPGMEV